MPDIDAVLDAITLADVYRALADLEDATIPHGHTAPHNQECKIGNRKYGARPLITFAARHCSLKVPVGELNLYGGTDKKCRDKLEGLGFKFKAKTS